MAHHRKFERFKLSKHYPAFTVVRDLLAQGVPRKLPPAPFAWLGANAQMKWGK